MQSWCISEMSSFSHYLADFMYRFFLPSTDTQHTLQLSTCGRHWDLLFIPAALVFDTDLSSLIGSQSPPLSGQFKGEGEACRAQIYAWCPRSRKQPLILSSRPCSGPSPPPRRWWILWPHPGTLGPAGELSLYRNYRWAQRGETGEYENISDEEKPCLQ